MRVRLSLLPPFRESKILLPVPVEVTTISELRRHLVRSLAAISSVVEHAREVVLEIEGFELLGGSGVGVIEEKDVVCVRVAAGSSKPDPSHPVREAAKKRKSRRSSPGEIAPAPAKRARKSTSSTSASTSKPMSAARPRPQEITPRSAAPAHAHAHARILNPARKRSGSASSSVSSSSSDSSSSSSAASSSSSDSDASSSSPSPSSSSSSSSSGSSSSAASSASERPGKLNGSAAFPLPPSAIITNTHGLGVAPPPPGQGKPETHNRNIRRRKARQMKKLASEQAQQSAQPPTTSPAGAGAVIPKGLGSTHDALPLHHTGDIHILATTMPTTPGLQMPKEMANRNKRKGFFREMNALQGTRTVFSDHAAAAVAAAVGPAGLVENGEHEEHGGHGDGTPRRVKQLALDGVHTTITSPSTTPQATPRTAVLPRIVPPSEKVLPSNVFVTSREFERVRPPKGAVNGYANGVDRATEEAEEVEAGEAEEYHSEVQAEEYHSEVQAEDDEAMWSRVEQSWDKLPVLISEELGSFKQGTLIAWKELELDLNTFSPELKLHIARVTAISTDGAAQLDQLKRPVLEGEVWEEYEQSEAGVEEETVLRLSKEEVQAGAGKWRVVRSLSG